MSNIIGVFKGGGAKGALYVGALQAVRDRGLEFSQVAGSSAGAITAAFVAAGATPKEVRAAGDHADTLGLVALPSALAAARNLRSGHGILPIGEVRAWLARWLACLYRRRLGGRVDVKSAGPTFGQLAAAGAIPLHIVAADLHWKTPVVFNAQLTPELPIADAAAASSAIPFVFESPLLSSAEGAQVLVADGGVLANLPLFLFTDPGYRTLAGLPAEQDGDPVVGFTLVSGGRALPVEVDAARQAYQERYGGLTASTTRSGLVALAGPTREKAGPFRWLPRWPGRLVTRAAAAVLDVVLLVMGRVVLPVVNRVLGSATKASTASLRVDSPRLKPWADFAERVFMLGPGYVLLALVFLPAVVLVGMPAVVASLWPDWASIGEGEGVGGQVAEWVWALAGSLILLIAMLVVIVLILLGIVAYGAGWVSLPVATTVAPGVAQTFLRNPQEPAWAGLEPQLTMVRVDVPAGWTALRTTEDPEVLTRMIERVRLSVTEQLEAAGLGAAMPPRTGGG